MIYLHGHDVMDNVCKHGGDSFTVRLVGDGDGEQSARLNDLGDGTYSIQTTIKKAGGYKPTSASTATTSPDRRSTSPSSLAELRAAVVGGGLGLAASAAGVGASFVVQAVDCFGNKQTKGGDRWVATMTRPGEPDQFGAVRDREDGSYEVVPTVTRSGMWKLHVTLGGVQIAGGPFDVAVSAGPMDAFASIAAGDGIKQAYTGEVSVFMLRTKDAYATTARRAATTSVRCSCRARPARRCTRRSSTRATARTRCGIRSRSRAATTTSCPLSTSTTARSAAPAFRVVALAGPTNCGATISVRAPRCVAGTVSEAPIFAKDRQGNQRTSGGDVFTAALQMIDPPLLNETLRVEDNNDGTYKALWLTTHTGKFRLWIAGPCGPIKDSPYDVECLPAALSVTHSYLKGDGASDAIAGHAAAFEIIARDVFDNVLAFGRYAWAVSLSNDQNSFKVHQLAGSGEHLAPRTATPASPAFPTISPPRPSLYRRRLVQVCLQRDAGGDLRPDGGGARPRRRRQRLGAGPRLAVHGDGAPGADLGAQVEDLRPQLPGGRGHVERGLGGGRCGCGSRHVTASRTSRTSRRRSRRRSR